MTEIWTAENEKAQYEDRIRALERRIIAMQDLVEGQHKYIEYLRGLIGASNKKYDEKLDSLVFEEPSNEGVIIVPTESSTTPTLYPQPSAQMQNSQQFPESTGSSQESGLGLGSLQEHTEQS